LDTFAAVLNRLQYRFRLHAGSRRKFPNKMPRLFPTMDTNKSASDIIFRILHWLIKSQVKDDIGVSLFWWWNGRLWCFVSFIFLLIFLSDVWLTSLDHVNPFAIIKWILFCPPCLPNRAVLWNSFNFNVANFWEYF
jgi:hypothetical protein